MRTFPSSSLLPRDHYHKAQHGQLIFFHLQRHRRRSRRRPQPRPLHRPQVRSRRLHRRHSRIRSRYLVRFFRDDRCDVSLVIYVYDFCILYFAGSLSRFADEIAREEKGQVFAIRIDCSDSKSVREAFEGVLSLGFVEVLVYNAYTSSSCIPSSFFDIRVQSFEKSLAVSSVGAFHCAQQVIYSCKLPDLFRQISITKQKVCLY